MNDDIETRLAGELQGRNLPPAPPELVEAYAAAVRAAGEAAARRARARSLAERLKWSREHTRAVQAMLAVRRGLGLEPGRRVTYAGAKAMRVAAAAAVGGVFEPLPVPPFAADGKVKPN
jgi:hypothetical protein